MTPATRLAVGVLCIALVCGQTGCFTHTSIYRLGGIREPVVTIKEDRKKFEVTTRFLAVDAFDQVTNDKLNRQKGESFAFIALARHMGIDKTQSVLVRGLSPIASRTQNQYAEVIFLVKKDGIQRVNSPAREEIESLSFVPASTGRPSERIVSLSASSFMVKEYLEKIRLIECAYREAVSNLPVIGDSFYESVAELEDDVLRQYNLFQSRAKDDTGINDSERGRILSEITRARDDFLSLLRREVESVDQISE